MWSTLRPFVIVLAVVVAAQVAACGGESDRATTTIRSTATSTATTPTPTTGATTPQGGIDTMSGASTDPVHVPATNEETALLTDVRAARHEGYDRVVFEFRNVLPGYDLSQASAPSTYAGPQRFTPGTPEVVELARSGGFEGVLTWVAGLRDPVDFRVTSLAAPPRLIVDFRNH